MVPQCWNPPDPLGSGVSTPSPGKGSEAYPVRPSVPSFAAPSFAMNTSRSSLWLAVAALAVGFLPPGLAAAPRQGLRFDSPGVLNWSERTVPGGGKPAIAVVPLAAGEGERILAMPALAEEHGSLPVAQVLFGCAPPSEACERAGERKRIAAAGDSVRRAGQRLSVNPASGAVAVFVDWNQPATRTAEGDSESHRYLGRLDGSGYHRVDVRFGHDAPGSFLVNPANGGTVFVHDGGDVVALAPDGLRLVTFNALNPPLSLRLGILDAAGPRLELHCLATGDRSSLQFKGWRDPQTFDLVVKPNGTQDAAAIPVRVERSAGAWRLATPAPARLVEVAGFGCRP